MAIRFYNETNKMDQHNIRFTYHTKRIEQVRSPVIPIIGEMVANHPGTISLGQGVVYYGPPKESLEQVESFWQNPANHKYHLVNGITPLRQVLIEKLEKENGIIIDSNNEEAGYRLCVTAGGNMAFMNAMLAITEPGDEVILLTPFYFNHEMAIHLADCHPVPVDTDEEFQPNLSRIREAITDRTKAVVSVSPNNPSGAVYPEKTLRAINQLCKECGIYHINDEAYEYFTYDDASHFSPGRISDAEQYTISLFSLSKSYGFAGWRIGYMVFPSPLEVAVKKIQDTILICPPTISQYAAYGALLAGCDYCREMQQEIVAVREMILNELDAIRDICYIPQSKGAFYILLKLCKDENPMTLAERLIGEHGVAVMPGDSFGMSNGCYFRIAYGALQKHTAEEGIQRLVRGLRSLVGSL